MSERELVKIVTVDEVIRHPNADALEIAVIGGWQCCVKLGEFVAGSKGVYFEIDSMLPLDKPEFEFLAKRNEREFEGKVYSRIRTMKLRGELSQGLLLPMTTLDSLPKDSLEPLQELLGVVKYEPTLAACLSGIAKGNFPSFLRKSGLERCQNLKREITNSIDAGEEFEVTYKLDGSSFTAYAFKCSEDEVYTGVCSRNLELKIDESNSGNTFVQTFISNDLDGKLRGFYQLTNKLVAIQGEMCGPSIQNNFEGLDKVELFVYSVFDIREQQYMAPDAAKIAVELMGLQYVPIYTERHVLTESIGELLALADGESGLRGKFREGLVFKSLSREFSFKAISNRYLIKTGG